MATLTFNQSCDGQWLPDVWSGGSIALRQPTRMTYTSDAGYLITLRGNGLTYDADGDPSGGTVTNVVIARQGMTYGTLTGVSMDFAYAGMKLFGYDSANSWHQNPDGFAAMQNCLRGDDLVIGSAQNDNLRGGTGDDTILAGTGDDYVGVEAGKDSMDGGDGWDTLSFADGNWQSSAWRGITLDSTTGIAVDNWGGTDRFSNFESFKDSLYSDTLKGTTADEENFYISRGNDVVDGRGGYDEVNYSMAADWGAKRGVVVNLGTGIGIDSWKGTDTLISVEGVQGTTFNDRLIGGAGDETFLGDAGVDIIDGGDGYDRMAFWNIASYTPGGHGIVINLTAIKNVVDDGFGNAETALNIESYSGSHLGDRMTGDGDANSFWANDGDDTLVGGAGDDGLNGQDGNDSMQGGLGNDWLAGQFGNDTLTGNSGQDDFAFDQGLFDSGVDTLSDFVHGVDQVWIRANWIGANSQQQLDPSQFLSGTGATSATSSAQRLIYNTSTGDLYFDPDGSGAQAATKFAILTNLAALGAEDIWFFV